MRTPRLKYNNNDATIHTRIDAKLKERLLEYGKGQMNAGIETLIEIADKQKITVTIITEITL